MSCQADGGPGTRTQTSHPESVFLRCTAQTEEGKQSKPLGNFIFFPRRQTKGSAFAEQCQQTPHPPHASKDRSPAGAWALYWGQGIEEIAPQVAGVTGNCSGTKRHDEVGGSGQKGLA